MGDGRTKYSRAVKMLSQFPDGAEVSAEALKKTIMKEMAGTKKLVSDAIVLMKETGLIVEIEQMKFRVTKNG